MTRMGSRGWFPAGMLLAALSLVGVVCPPPARGAGAARTDDGALAVIVSAKTRIRNISLSDLRRCFLGQSVELEGVRLVPFNHPAHAQARKQFDARVLGMSLMASQRYWINNMIRGGVRPPRTVPDARLLVKVVASLQGAVSYASKRWIANEGGVRAVTVDGIELDDPRYPLR